MLNKAQKQELLNKHAKFFAADKKEKQKIFQGIRYAENGSAYVSNTHVLLRMKDVSPFSEPCTLHAVTGAEIEGNYVSKETMDGLLTYDPENQIIFENSDQIEIVTRHAKIAQMIGKELKSAIRITNLILDDRDVFLGVNVDYGDPVFKVPVGYAEEGQEETWVLNADYLYNALNLFKSAKSKSLVIKLRHKNDAITLSDEENGIDVLILPIRTDAGEE